MGRASRVKVIELNITKLPDALSIEGTNECNGIDKVQLSKLNEALSIKVGGRTSGVASGVKRDTVQLTKLNDAISIKVGGRVDEVQLTKLSNALSIKIKAEIEVPGKSGLTESVFKEFPELKRLTKETDSITYNSGLITVFRITKAGAVLNILKYTDAKAFRDESREFVHNCSDRYYKEFEGEAPWIKRRLRRGNGSYQYVFRCYLDSISTHLGTAGKRLIRKLTSPAALMYFVKNQDTSEDCERKLQPNTIRHFVSEYETIRVTNKEVIEAFKKYEQQSIVSSVKKSKSSNLAKLIRLGDFDKLKDSDYELLRTGIKATMVGTMLACDITFDPELIFGVENVTRVFRRFKAQILRDAKPKVIEYHKQHVDDKSKYLTDLKNYKYTEPMAQAINVIVLWKPIVDIKSPDYE